MDKIETEAEFNAALEWLVTAAMTQNPELTPENCELVLKEADRFLDKKFVRTER